MRCLICASTMTMRAHGVVAPWISELSDQPSPDNTDLYHCPECTFMGFSHRFSESELQAMYGHYRSEEYMHTRQRWEPWYRQSVNDATKPGSPAVIKRLNFMRSVLKHTQRNQFSLAVDIGVDAGQYIPPEASGDKYVIEMSDITPLPGVKSAHTLTDLPGTPDLVLICHVLEHHNNPTELITQARDAIHPDGVLYIEVPLDTPKPQPWHHTDNYRTYLSNLTRNRPAFIAQDLLTGLARQRSLHTPKLGVVKQSEHLNYFTESSLFTLLTQNGFTVQRWRAEPNLTMGGIRFGALGMVAFPTGARPPLID